MPLFSTSFLVIPIGALAYILTGGFNWKTMLITTTAGGFLFISMFVTFGFAIAQRINDLKKFALEQQMRLTEAYQRFVPDQLLRNLDKDSILDVQLGDQVQKEMSIMFSDIRSFTSLSESMTPEENFKFVNSYLSKMGPLVREHNGYIDKFIGDAIMALFEHSPEDAVRTSIEMLKTLREYNEGRNRAGYDLIQIGVGVNTGMMILGTLGEADRMEGSVISDAVNQAARLEGLTKLYKTPLLISETTMNQLTPEAFQTRLIDRVAVKGKKDPVLVYEVLDTDLSELMERKIFIRITSTMDLIYIRTKNLEKPYNCLMNVMKMFQKIRSLSFILNVVNCLFPKVGMQKLGTALITWTPNSNFLCQLILRKNFK